ncbi:MAG TPA: lysophospholipid acyltransferase family protein [Isosphaeraceae bacterium]|nr:lysophospholipid acyltransferase family protein [Isosphaeraceae bacterium]
MTSPPANDEPPIRTADRSWPARAWYRLVRAAASTLFCAAGGLRATGHRHRTFDGGALLVSNHLSYLDAFVLGIPLGFPLNYIARSTLFLPLLGPLIRSVGGFPIRREGMGASGLKETLRRVRDGGVVLLFPEGTRSRDGELAELKSGIAVLAARAKVPIIPAGLAGTFEAWPRNRPFPLSHPIRVHYGPPILPEELAGLEPEAITALIRDRLLDCQRAARRGLARDLGRRGDDAEIAVGRIDELD